LTKKDICININSKLIKKHSYPERWRDRPDETQQPEKYKVLIPAINSQDKRGIDASFIRGFFITKMRCFDDKNRKSL